MSSGDKLRLIFQQERKNDGTVFELGDDGVERRIRGFWIVETQPVIGAERNDDDIGVVR